jgi:hypothetical protein
MDVRPDIASFFRTLGLEFVVLSLWEREKLASEQQGMGHSEDKVTGRHEYLKITAILLAKNCDN